MTNLILDFIMMKRFTYFRKEIEWLREVKQIQRKFKKSFEAIQYKLECMCMY